MQDFLSIRLEEIPSEPSVALFTLKTNIKSVQTKLTSEWDQKIHTVPEILRLLQTQSSSDPNVFALNISDDGRISYRNVKCPHCGSSDYKLNGTQKRQLKSSFSTVLDIRLQKYRCHICENSFKVDLSHIVPKYGHYTRDIRDQAVGYSGSRALSLGEGVELTEQISGVHLTRETVRLWKINQGNTIQTDMEIKPERWSDTYSYDEQYIKISGQKHYRCLIYDVVMRKPVSDLIVPNLEEETLRNFLKSSLAGKPVKTIITDGSTKYPSLLLELFPEASHQLCVIHAMYNAKCDFNEAAGLGKGSDKLLPQPLAELYGKLWGVFIHSENVKEAEDRFFSIYKKRFEYPSKVRHRLELMAGNFIRLTEYLVHDDVPMTNNPAEGYFQRTYPERIKKRFRTPEGFQAQISCLDGSKGGWTENDPSFHEPLRVIYQTFAKLLAFI